MHMSYFSIQWRSGELLLCILHVRIINANARRTAIKHNALRYLGDEGFVITEIDAAIVWNFREFINEKNYGRFRDIDIIARFGSIGSL